MKKAIVISLVALLLNSMNPFLLAQTVATPYTEKDTIRVVMQPGGNGKVIGFFKDAEGKIGSMNYGGVTFTKLAQ